MDAVVRVVSARDTVRRRVGRHFFDEATWRRTGCHKNTAASAFRTVRVRKRPVHRFHQMLRAGGSLPLNLLKKNKQTNSRKENEPKRKKRKKIETNVGGLFVPSFSWFDNKKKNEFVCKESEKALRNCVYA